ncbi:HAMP domain-containing sensor histidine kinase [Meiothermus sp. CFH 77666]|uniref:sensor histidine kinase n=1 Tax=Meiothermus sp. CFH 77666 TaxID=2817942 RepID=UPI001AA01687|nr:HAMP domain-containing sensor histidine kinase [Meiothermus sp. CFH 77666]MBO1436880.1 HAMP domain-containing histidine kinase [Meiothermus sp. CFH 77666]
MRGRLKTWPRHWVWWAFGLVVAFLLAQVSWWLAFQRNYIQQNIEYAETAWLQEAALVQQLWAATAPEKRSALLAELKAAFPHLEVEGERVYVNPERLAAYRAEQMRHLRMFAFEGPVFLLVMLLGLYIIGRSLRSEQEYKRRQQNLLLAATHEFRTPISTLRLLTQTLELRELPREKALAYLAHMTQEIARLEDLTERLLTTSRLAQGLGQVKPERLELNRLTGLCLARQQSTLTARGAQLNFEPAPHPLPVKLDPEAFGLVFSNLLDNAVKYTPAPEKPIWVRLRLEKDQAVLEVEDRGVGLPKGEIPQLFEPFYRVGDEQIRRTRGLGLGLYLVKSITELMGGRVRAEALPKGSRFTLSFPLAETERRPV